MNGYERLIKVMRAEAQKASGGVKEQNRMRIGIMTAKNECKIDTLELDQDDLLVLDAVKEDLKKGDEVLLYKLNEDTYIILGKVVEI